MIIAETERLVLRRFRPDDAAGLFEYLSQPETVKFEPYDVFTAAQAEAEAAERAASPDFIAVCLKDGGKLIGNIYLHDDGDGNSELGYVFHARHLHRGYATEAARAALNFAFAGQHAHRVYAMCDPKNAPSWRLLERLSMRREAHLRKNVFFRRDETGLPLWKDTFIYAILREEWQKEP